MSATTATASDVTVPRRPVSLRGDSFWVVDEPATRAVLPAFTGSFEAGTLAFFDAVLPGCDRMVDVGGHVGLTALYAAGRVQRVDVFEPNPDSVVLLRANLAQNPERAARIQVHPEALAATDGVATLYAKALADSGSSLLRVVERSHLLAGRPRAQVPVRHAAGVLSSLGVSPRVLVKIDTEGAEYEILPALAPLLADRRPPLHVSFHPFNVVAGRDLYGVSLARLRCAIAAAEALACYRYMHLFDPAQGLVTVGPEERADFLDRYFLRRKGVERIGSPQYGFIDGIGFTDTPLPAL